MNEKEKVEKLKLYLAKALKDLKKFERISDEELYQRGIDVTKSDLKRAKVKISKCLSSKNIENILKEYEYYMDRFDDISKYFSKCNKLVTEYKNERNSL